MNSILLVGYYGKGNFGDDVLFIVTYNFVKKIQPNASISVFCDNCDNQYFSNLIGENIKTTYPGEREHFDMVIHGGGGTFFDFNKGSLADLAINFGIKLIGYHNFCRLEKLIRQITGKTNITTEKRYGLGLGVGTFTASSKKFKYNIPTLQDFDSLIVRDSTSVGNLLRLGIKRNIEQGSDLAFMDNFWVPRKIKNKTSNRDKLRVGLILRDWNVSLNTNYLTNIEKMLGQLNESFVLTIFVFDQQTDHEVRSCAHKYSSCVWNPSQIEFDAYCERIADQDVIVTSRAHGAMCGAVLAVPSVLIDIEPKLRTIHALLNNSTSLLSVDSLTIEVLMDEIHRLHNIDKKIIEKDVQKNKMLITNTIASIGLEND